MHFKKINEIRNYLAPHYGKSFTEKCKILWKAGWEKAPAETLTVIFTPVVLVHGLWEYYLHDTRFRKRKYQRHITIYRPDDPRVAEIQQYSILDK